MWDHYNLTFITNIKNYHNEWELFLDWVRPWVDENEYPQGYLRYEDSETPSAVYFRDGDAQMIQL